jgi:GNAT superfamily N-acetyltransferase
VAEGVIEIGPEGIGALSGEPLYDGFDASKLASQRPDAHLALDRGGARARASLWWSEAPPLSGERVGAIGHFAALDADAAAEVLAAACTRLRAAGCTLAVGPMDGNTWRSYRFVTERGCEPPFFLEPDNPDEYPDWWAAAGFSPLAGYSSALETDLAIRDPRVSRIEARVDEAGVTIRGMDAVHADEELARIHRVSLVAFAKNLLFTPEPLEEFAAAYRPLVPLIDPSLVLVAERGGEPVGFILALPDMAQAARGRKPDAVIIKTVAVLPGRDFAGLGSLLVDRVRVRAAEMGYSRAIDALMYDSNASRRISDRFATTMRRYTLFSKALA